MVLDVLSSIGAMPGLKLLDAELVAEAITLARHTNSDFADAYIVAGALAAGADEIASFNRAHFERLAQSWRNSKRFAPITCKTTAPADKLP